MSNNIEMPKVVILSADVDERSGTFENASGDDIAYTVRKQKARLETNGFVYPYDVRLDKHQPAYPVGDYTLDLSAMLQINKAAHFVSKYPVLRAISKPASPSPAKP